MMTYNIIGERELQAHEKNFMKIWKKRTKNR